MKPLFPLFLLLAAACVTAGSMQNVELTAARSGSTVTLTLTNRSDAAIGYNLCTSGLQRREANDWAAVRTDDVCTMELRTLQPGESATFEKTLPAHVQPDTYRYVTNVESPVGGSRVVVISDSFTVD